MKTVEVNIGDIRENQNNPRLIKDDKFKKLVQSIKDFPQMLAIRPIVVNADMTVLGGNMRLKACKEAGLKKVPILVANDLTDAQQQEFIKLVQQISKKAAIKQNFIRETKLKRIY